MELWTRGYDEYMGRLDRRRINFVAVRKDEKFYIQAIKEILIMETKI